MGFGKALLRAHSEVLRHRPEPVLRQKKDIHFLATDVEIFRSLPTGDLWGDANLMEVYQYLRTNKNLVVPECWEVALAEFEEDAQRAAWLQLLMCQIVSMGSSIVEVAAENPAPFGLHDVEWYASGDVVEASGSSSHA